MENLLSRIKILFNLTGRNKPPMSLAVLFRTFQRILELNNRILEAMADIADKLGGDYVFDRQYIYSSCRQLANLVHELIYNFNALASKPFAKLNEVFRNINTEIQEELAGKRVIPQTEYVMPYTKISRDVIHVVGGKNANIAEIRNRLTLPVPEGFAITTRAFEAFLEHNDFKSRLQSFLKAWEAGEMTPEQASGRIREMILSGSVPSALVKAVHREMKLLQQITGKRNLFLAIRSSAIGEDSEHTFAGQYESLINQPQSKFFQCYKDVLAGTYSASAMEYRRQKGFAEHEVAMAVACQLMVDAQVSGVLYTLDPVDPTHELMTISASWGLGGPIVAGEVSADRFTISREPPYSVQSLDIVRKTVRLVPKQEGECEFQPVSGQMQMSMCLSEDQIRKIAEAGLVIERYFKCHQDIEWAIDPDGRLFVLQARPLNIKVRMKQAVCDISALKERFPVVFSGKGTIVQNGIATGRAFLVRNDSDLESFPHGAILVARETSPRFARVAGKATGIITDVGSSTGHMATISREFRIPTVVNTGVATDLLKSGQEITLDAEENVIYEGSIKELCYYSYMGEAFEETYEYRLLRRVLRKITPLNLVDPHDRNFSPAACRTYHDITRFVHEKAVEALINLDYQSLPEAGATRKRLKSEIPLDLIIIDIQGGLKEAGSASFVTPDKILSVPMAAFLKGLNAPGVWSREPMSVDFGSFMSSLTRTFSSHHVSPKNVGQNLAVISGQYANINLRLGYHFNMIDAYIGNQVNDNYAYFRFLGGVTDPVRRSRRAKFIYDALAKHDFNVDLRGDLVIGRVKKLEEALMKKKMALIGQLVGFTRQLDVQMNSDQQIVNFAEKFEKLLKADGCSPL